MAAAFHAGDVATRVWETVRYRLNWLLRPVIPRRVRVVPHAWALVVLVACSAFVVVDFSVGVLGAPSVMVPGMQPRHASTPLFSFRDGPPELKWNVLVRKVGERPVASVDAFFAALEQAGPGAAVLIEAVAADGSVHHYDAPTVPFALWDPILLPSRLQALMFLICGLLLIAMAPAAAVTPSFAAVMLTTAWASLYPVRLVWLSYMMRGSPTLFYGPAGMFVTALLLGGPIPLVRRHPRLPALLFAIATLGWLGFLTVGRLPAWTFGVSMFLALVPALMAHLWRRSRGIAATLRGRLRLFELGMLSPLPLAALFLFTPSGTWPYLLAGIATCASPPMLIYAVFARSMISVDRFFGRVVAASVAATVVALGGAGLLVSLADRSWLGPVLWVAAAALGVWLYRAVEKRLRAHFLRQRLTMAVRQDGVAQVAAALGTQPPSTCLIYCEEMLRTFLGYDRVSVSLFPTPPADADPLSLVQLMHEGVTSGYLRLGAPVDDGVLSDSERRSLVALAARQIAEVLYHRKFLPLVGGYRVLRLIGVGGMGSVFLGVGTSGIHRGEPVALKALRQRRHQASRYDDGKARLVREAEMASMLHHPNIVQTFGVVTAEEAGDDEHLFVALEFVDGADLHHLLMPHVAPFGCLPLEIAMALGLQLCAALQYAHEPTPIRPEDQRAFASLGLESDAARPLRPIVVHGDVSPDNLLCNRNGELKLADFGIAAMVGEDAVSGGKCSYAAPERIAGTWTVDRRADVYSVGVILYEWFTGHHPYRCATRKETTRAAVRGRVLPAGSIRADLPMEISDAIAHAMAVDPRERCPDIPTLAAALRATPMGRELPSSSALAAFLFDQTQRTGAWNPADLSATRPLLTTEFDHAATTRETR